PARQSRDDVLEADPGEDRDAVPGAFAVRRELVAALAQLSAEQVGEGRVGELRLLQADDVGRAFVQPRQQPRLALLDRVDVPGGDPHPPSLTTRAAPGGSTGLKLG